MILDLFDGFEVIPPHPFGPDRAVVALDVSILLLLTAMRDSWDQASSTPSAIRALTIESSPPAD